MSKAKPRKATKKYLFHELSSYLPLLEGEEFDALVEDIRQFGQIEPVVLYEGKILDGRNRYRACKQIGIELEVREWKPSEATGMTPLQFVISENIMRRHLNTAQRGEIGLLLLEEEEKLAQERQKELAKLKKRDEEGKFIDIEEDNLPLDTEKFGEKGRSAIKVGKKVKISDKSLSRAKKIKEIAENEPLIAEDWEKAKREEIGIETVYEKAKIVEEAQNLPLRQKTEVMEALKKEEIPAKKLREILQEKKDDLKRMELAKKARDLQKRKQEMDKLRLQIRSLEKTIDELERAKKSVVANLQVLTEEASKKYPKYASKDPSIILTKLGTHYDGLNMDALDSELENLRNEYDEKMDPLRKELERLESEFEEKKAGFDKEKEKINKEAIWIEKHQNAMMSEYDKIEVYQQKIEENKNKLITLQEKYDNEYKTRENV